MAVQEPGRTRGFPCKHCGVVCSDMPSLVEHTDRHLQEEEERRFKCEECGRGYRHAGSLANHKKTHDVGSFQCQICERKLSNALALKSHLRIHTSQKKYSCMECGKAFRLATQLTTHEKVHISKEVKGRLAMGARMEYSPIGNQDEMDDTHDLDGQPASAFATQQHSDIMNSLENSSSGDETGMMHSSDATGERMSTGDAGDRPFKCDLCEKTYRHHGSLINHRKSHQVGMFECPVCFKHFSNLAALQSHQRIHNKPRSGPGSGAADATFIVTTPDQFSPQSSEAPVHFCHLCQVLFPNDDEFQEHIQMHNSSSMSFGLNESSSLDHSVSYENSVAQTPESSFYSSPINNAPSMLSSMDNHGDFDQSVRLMNNGRMYSDQACNETPSIINTQVEPSIMDSNIANPILAHSETADDPLDLEEASAADADERRFKCQICSKSYRHAGSLINHKRSHQTGIFQCSICRKSYPHMAALRSHLRLHKAQPSCYNLGSEGDWLSSEPLTLENQQGCFSSMEEDSSGMISIAQENSGEHNNGTLIHKPFHQDFTLDRTVHLPHDEHLMDRHMCADCGETFADIAGIKSHMCPLLQQHAAPSNGYGSHLDFQETNGQYAIGNPGDHLDVKLNGSHDQRLYGEPSYQEMKHKQLNGGGEVDIDGEEEEEEEEEEEDDDDCELYQCSVCGNRYTSMRALRSHLRGHTQAHSTPASSGPSSMSSHEEVKDEDPGERQQVDGGLMICSTCGESFAKKQDLLAHQLLHNQLQADDTKHLHVDHTAGGEHKEEAASIICGNCGIFCSSYNHLENHGCTAERGNEPAADEESRKVDNGSEDKQLGHPKENVLNGDRQYRCDQCGRSYRHAGSLLNHKKSHKTGVFRCLVCQKRFYNLLALKNHQRTHFDVKRHTCHECGKAFKIQKQLLNHLRMHKENQAKIQELNNQIQALMQMNGTGSNERMRSLSANGSRAPSLRKRRRNQKARVAVEAESSTGLKSEASGDLRPYACDQCGRTYRHAGSLVNHKNSHKTGEYCCSVCNNTYSNQLAMKNHLRTHLALQKHCCQNCGKGFRGKKQLLNHVCAHLRKDNAGRSRERRQTRKCKCKECGLAFISADQLTAHTCTGPSENTAGQVGTPLKKEERPFTCNICSRSYRHAGSLLNHKNTHKTGHFSCTFCSKPFSNPMALRNHTRIHTQKKKYVCLTCGKAFRLASILHNHQKVHNRAASHFSCPACGKSFQGKSGLKRHRCHKGPTSRRASGNQSDGGDKCFMCDLCGRSYRHAGSLLNHKKTHSENLHHCTLCLQTFPDPLTLQIHSQMKRHCCPECGKTFCLIAHLQSHMEVHAKDRSLVCSPCQQSFHNAASLQQHQDMHHRAQGQYNPPGMTGAVQMESDLCWSSGIGQAMGLQGMPKLVPAFDPAARDPASDPQEGAERPGAEEKSHVCEHCGRAYRHAGSLLNHKNSHKTGSFFCSVCQKEFTNLMALKNHRRIHTEPKRYQCLECGKAFRVSTQLICHRRIHTKEKPFSCLLCDKSFSSKSNLRHHQKMHQNAQAYDSSFGMEASTFMDLDMGSFL